MQEEKLEKILKNMKEKIVRWKIIEKGKSIDGSEIQKVSKIVQEVGIMKRKKG